jgi:hypothetical protein
MNFPSAHRCPRRAGIAASIYALASRTWPRHRDPPVARANERT